MNCTRGWLAPFSLLPVERFQERFPARQPLALKALPLLAMPTVQPVRLQPLAAQLPWVARLPLPVRFHSGHTRLQVTEQ
jgi:hypothetical protein